MGASDNRQADAARPTYENSVHLRREAALKNRVEASFNCRLHKLPRYCLLDFIATSNDEVKAVVEVKCRAISSDTHPTIILSASKWKVAGKWRAVGVRAILVFEFTDGDFFHELGDEYIVTMGGRKDRGDEDDVEPVIHIPSAAWSPVVRRQVDEAA